MFSVNDMNSQSLIVSITHFANLTNKVFPFLMDSRNVSFQKDRGVEWYFSVLKSHLLHCNGSIFFLTFLVVWRSLFFRNYFDLFRQYSVCFKVSFLAVTINCSSILNFSCHNKIFSSFISGHFSSSIYSVSDRYFAERFCERHFWGASGQNILFSKETGNKWQFT